MYGIGITTKNRKHFADALVDSIYKHTDMDKVVLYVADDSVDEVGVSVKKNECLRNLKGCDHVFLMDDDIEILQEGWADFFINSGENHLLFLNDKLHNCYAMRGNVKIYRDCGGVFMYMAKEAIDRAGAFDEKFKGWGMEHCNYSVRILGGHGEYPHLVGTEKYIYSHDYFNPVHQSSISNEEKQKYFDLNFPKFKEPIKNIYIPL